MEGSGAGIGRLDCYEDMFKEITRKLYGDDPDHRTSSVQNEFETSVSYKNDDDTDQGTDGSDDGNWTCDDEPLKGTDGSRIAAYHAGKTTWRCYECGDCMGGGPRDIAEHFVELHSSRIITDETRNRHNNHNHHHHHHNSPRKSDFLHGNDLKIEDVVSYLERVRDRAERSAPPSRRTQETQTVPAALLPVTTTFLIQELPTVSPTGGQQTQQHLHQSSATMTTTTTTTTGNSASGKRYTCPNCPYGTDRRDLYTRHENIHREEKPFHCYICYKPFNRADHVKKHFLRMHREHGYELSRIRRTASGTSNAVGNGGAGVVNQTTAPASAAKMQQSESSGIAGQSSNGSAQSTGNNYAGSFNNNKAYQIQTGQGTNGTGSGIYQNSALTVQGIAQNEINCAASNRRVQNGGCNSKSHVKGGTKGAQERRYTCCYCSWSGVDNWCLKRHLNTHLKPFACALCEYKAARAERLATHVLKVHNKRQCSRCSFLGEDAAQLQVHQLHVHRVSSASAPAATTQQTPTANNRLLQPVHPSGGGRPPPGPPVFPASSPAIAPATSVIPSTTILGKMGLGESKMSLCYDDWWMRVAQPLRPSNDCQTSVNNGTGRRSRKQSTPRKVLIDNCDENDEDVITVNSGVQTSAKLRVQQQCVKDNGIRDNDKITKDYLKCYQCPENSPARGTASKPYHTKASLALHTLWRHRRVRRANMRSAPVDGARAGESVNNSSSAGQQGTTTTETPRSSITLKATVITTSSSNYRYRR